MALGRDVTSSLIGRRGIMCRVPRIHCALVSCAHTSKLSLTAVVAEEKNGKGGLFCFFLSFRQTGNPHCVVCSCVCWLGQVFFPSIGFMQNSKTSSDPRKSLIQFHTPWDSLVLVLDGNASKFYLLSQNSAKKEKLRLSSELSSCVSGKNCQNLSTFHPHWDQRLQKTKNRHPTWQHPENWRMCNKKSMRR